MCRNIMFPYHDEAKKVVESAIFPVNSNEFNFVVILLFFAIYNIKKKDLHFYVLKYFIYHSRMLFSITIITVR